MSTPSYTYCPQNAGQPKGRRPWCAACRTDRHLVIDDVTGFDAEQKTLAAAIRCTKCGGARVVATTAAFLAAIPGQSNGNADLMHRDAGYVHCGEPMLPPDPELRSTHTVIFTEAAPDDFLSVYLTTRVLRCRCGFQIEIPR